MSEDKLPDLDDHHFSEWLQKQYSKCCKKEHRWKTHLDQSHGVYEYQQAIRMKRCIRECAAYEEQAQVYADAIAKVSDILAACLARNEISPLTYQTIMDTLQRADIRRQRE